MSLRCPPRTLLVLGCILCGPPLQHRGQATVPERNGALAEVAPPAPTSEWMRQPLTGRFWLPGDDPGRPVQVGVDADGAVVCRMDAPAATAAAGAIHPPNPSSEVTLRFGMPPLLPVRRWLEDERLPILHTQWEQGGIGYLQSVAVGRLWTEAQGPPRPPHPDLPVLLVRLYGRNLTNLYAPGSAAFRLEAPLPVPLRLEDGQVFEETPTGRVFRASLDLRAEARTDTNRTQLTFEASLPPGTDGAMFVRIPLVTVTEAADLEALRLLDGEEELRRIKKVWKARPDPPPRPLREPVASPLTPPLTPPSR